MFWVPEAFLIDEKSIFNVANVIDANHRIKVVGDSLTPQLVELDLGELSFLLLGIFLRLSFLYLHRLSKYTMQCVKNIIRNVKKIYSSSRKRETEILFLFPFPILSPEYTSASKVTKEKTKNVIEIIY